MEGYARQVARVLSAILVLNLAVVVAKIVVGVRSGSLAVVADAFHSLLDAGNNVVALVILRHAVQPPDEDHPFGHAKFETVAAFVLAGLLFVTAFEILQSAAARFLEPAPPTVDALTAATLVATLGVNVAVTWWEGREGERLGSELLRADAAHTRADVVVTLAVLGGLVLSRFGFARADPVLAVFVAGFIAWAGFRIFASTVPVLTDRAVFAAEEIRAVVEGVPGVQNVHDIRSRGHPREAYVQMHLVVEPDDVRGAHAITEEVERALEDQLGVKEAVIHVEPEADEPR